MSEWMTESIHSWCSSLLLLAITLSGVIFMAGPNFYLQRACHFSEAQPNLPSSEGLLKFPCSLLVPVSQSSSPSIYVAYSYVLMFFFFNYHVVNFRRTVIVLFMNMAFFPSMLLPFHFSDHLPLSSSFSPDRATPRPFLEIFLSLFLFSHIAVETW